MKKLSKPAQAAIRAVLAVVGAMALAAPVLATPIQLIVNGNFESAGLTTGWTSATSNTGNNSFYRAVNGANATVSSLAISANPVGGTYYALGDQNGQGAAVIMQAFTKTLSNPTLTLSFDWFDNTHGNYAGTALASSTQVGRVDIVKATASAFDTTSGVVSSLLLNAGTKTATGVTIPWVHETFDLSSLAPGAYKLRFGESANTNFHEMGFDNVSLLADSGSTIPEPGSLALGAIGLAGLLASRRKQRSVTAD